MKPRTYTLSELQSRYDNAEPDDGPEPDETLLSLSAAVAELAADSGMPEGIAEELRGIANELERLACAEPAPDAPD